MAPTAALLRTSGQASTSATCQRRTIPSRARCVRVQASGTDGFCRDKVAVARQVESKGQKFKVTFVGAGGETREMECPDNQYILDAADENGLDLPATCRGGICGACVARMQKGTLDSSDIADISFTLNEEEQAKGMVLLCMSRPTSDIVLETQSDWGYSLGVAEWKGATGKFESRPEPNMGKSWAELQGSKSQ
ncbi:hypothetical protein HYH03_014881 [Edaphochlamys debaryana]|uniref:Ferredoxin n=1 Tax=Edaphochlamys debaryana TaxID=47281 RepID=A0A835XMV5_9CHLO|nr:hypothetical protein HYH03_014881 [Edaphochlamys debaryana]|eukprot:KAG2486434.1 hypothetical protein HYH03_014881 [Edaphochlamys debaryana]